MMKRFLADKKGETLIETLAAILIFTMASIILYSMVTSASNISKKAKDMDASLERQTAIAEKADAESGTGTIVMTMEVPKAGGGTEVKEISRSDVKVFREDKDESLFAYYKTETAEGGK